MSSEEGAILSTRKNISSCLFLRYLPPHPQGYLSEDSPRQVIFYGVRELRSHLPEDEEHERVILRR